MAQSEEKEEKKSKKNIHMSIVDGLIGILYSK